MTPTPTRTAPRAPIDRKTALRLGYEAAAAQDRAGDTDRAVDWACRYMLKDANVHAGCVVRVTRGRHKGLTGIVETVNWTEAAVQLVGRPQWFSLWHRPEFEVVAP